MGNRRKVIGAVIIILSLVFVTSCSKSYFGTYQSSSNSNLYNSYIQIDSNLLIYGASSDMLGTVVQKVQYYKLDDSIFLSFDNQNPLKSSINSYYNDKINGIKITVSTDSDKNNNSIFCDIIINDSIKYIAKIKDTIFSRFKISKIELKDRGLEFIKDTIVTFSKKSIANVFEINIVDNDHIPVLNEKGKFKYLINGRKLILHKYDTLQKKYMKTDRIYLKNE